MARIPSPSVMVSMVELALQERAPEVCQRLHAAGDLAAFADLYARAMIERIDDLDDLGPVLRNAELPLLERARRIVEIRTRAVESVVAEMLSTESLLAVDPLLPSEG